MNVIRHTPVTVMNIVKINSGIAVDWLSGYTRYATIVGGRCTKRSVYIV